MRTKTRAKRRGIELVHREALLFFFDWQLTTAGPPGGRPVDLASIYGRGRLTFTFWGKSCITFDKKGQPESTVTPRSLPALPMQVKVKHPSSRLSAGEGVKVKSDSPAPRGSKDCSAGVLASNKKNLSAVINQHLLLLLLHHLNRRKVQREFLSLQPPRDMDIFSLTHLRT